MIKKFPISNNNQIENVKTVCEFQNSIISISNVSQIKNLII